MEKHHPTCPIESGEADICTCGALWREAAWTYEVTAWFTLGALADGFFAASGGSHQISNSNEERRHAMDAG